MSPYEYEGAPLTPAVFAALTLELIEPNDVTSRGDLIRLVTARHEELGGLPARGSLASTAKKALADLAARGRAVAPVHGHWRILPSLAAEGPDETVEFGAGPESVYVYYFPAYRDQAAHLGRDAWPMKIGMTTGEVPHRVRDQCGTAMPELPVVGLIFRTDNARLAEKMLHTSLESRGRRMADAPGKEWFMTGLAEVREILDFNARD